MTLRIERLRTMEQVAAFIEASEPAYFQPSDRTEAYEFGARTLARLSYCALDRPSKTLVKRLLAKTTGYSRAQLTRLIRQYRKTGRVADRRDGNQGWPFERVYTPADMLLQARVDADLGQMSGLATRVVLHREFHVFGDARFERLAGISASHIYNLRASQTYRTQRTVVVGTRAGTVAVGERRAPQPGCLLGLFPFVVVGFHADNGSEYINHTVAALLNKLHVRDFTKSRPRRSTDNALVEGKNTNVVRRFLGHEHIPRRFAPLVDAFAREHLSPYLNHHRPCLFASEREGANGRDQRVYRTANVRTPYIGICSPMDEPFETDLSNQFGDLPGFGAKLAQTREFRGFERRILAKPTGIPAPTISCFENGRRYPSFENLVKLAGQFDVSID